MKMEKLTFLLLHSRTNTKHPITFLQVPLALPHLQTLVLSNCLINSDVIRKFLVCCSQLSILTFEQCTIAQNFEAVDLVNLVSLHASSALTQIKYWSMKTHDEWIQLLQVELRKRLPQINLFPISL